MAIKVSYYGSKKPAPNVKPQRVINLADNTPRDKLPFGGNNPIDWMTGKHLFQLKKEEPVEMPEPVEIKTGKSVTLSEDGVIELKGDSNTPGDSKVYSTDESGNRGWHDAPKSIPDGTVDGQLLQWNDAEQKWQPALIDFLPEGTLDGQLLQWNSTTSLWVPTSLTQITFITAWRLDKAGHKFQIKTRTAYVLAPAAESAWTDILDADGGTLDPGLTL